MSWEIKELHVKGTEIVAVGSVQSGGGLIESVWSGISASDEELNDLLRLLAVKLAEKFPRLAEEKRVVRVKGKVVPVEDLAIGETAYVVAWARHPKADACDTRTPLYTTKIARLKGGFVFLDGRKRGEVVRF